MDLLVLHLVIELPLTISYRAMYFQWKKKEDNFSNVAFNAVLTSAKFAAKEKVLPKRFGWQSEAKMGCLIFFRTLTKFLNSYDFLTIVVKSFSIIQQPYFDRSVVHESPLGKVTTAGARWRCPWRLVFPMCMPTNVWQLVLNLEHHFSPGLYFYAEVSKHLQTVSLSRCFSLLIPATPSVTRAWCGLRSPGLQHTSTKEIGSSGVPITGLSA